MQLIVPCQKTSPTAKLPQYMTDGAGCFDLYADIDQTFTVYFSAPVTFPTGLKFEIPPGWVMLLYSRSGHGFNSNVRLANCVGVIDSDYRGEVMVKLTADEGGLLTVSPGDRIAQGMLIKTIRVQFEEAGDLSKTERGDGGFGSTG